MDPLGTGQREGGMRLAGIGILILVGLFLFVLPQALNIILSAFGLLALALLAVGSIGHDRGRR
jgi:hypothetical protein